MAVGGGVWICLEVEADRRWGRYCTKRRFGWICSGSDRFQSDRFVVDRIDLYLDPIDL